MTNDGQVIWTNGSRGSSGACSTKSPHAIRARQSDGLCSSFQIPARVKKIKWGLMEARGRRRAMQLTSVAKPLIMLLDAFGSRPFNHLPSLFRSYSHVRAITQAVLPLKNITQACYRLSFYYLIFISA